MADEGDVGGVGGAGVEQSFEWAGRAGEEEGAEGGRVHGVRLQRWRAGLAQQQIPLPPLRSASE